MKTRASNNPDSAAIRVRNGRPVIYQGPQPVSQAVCASASVTFSVTASGAGLTYQWNSNGVNIAGATFSSYTNASVAAGDAGNYFVVVSGTCSPPVTSSVVTLTVGSGTTAITTQPTDQFVNVGGTATFTVAASGVVSSSTYSWRTNGVALANGVNANGSTYSGQGTTTLTITGVKAKDAAIASQGFDCVVSGCTGSATTLPSTT